MIPKTEKEIELYFLLEELKKAKAGIDTPYMKESAINRYNELKSRYLKIVNELE